MTMKGCPEHYQFHWMQAREIIEVVIASVTDPVYAYHLASALKYLLRCTRKGGVADLRKCRDHLNWAIARSGDAVPNSGTSPPTTGRNAPLYDPADLAFNRHPMNAVALEMAEAAIKQSVGFEPWEAAP